MASSRKKRSRAVVTLLLCLAAVCIVAALVLYGLANRKLKALQQGADFEFTYAVTSQAAPPTRPFTPFWTRPGPQRAG